MGKPANGREVRGSKEGQKQKRSGGRGETAPDEATVGFWDKVVSLTI